MKRKFLFLSCSSILGLILLTIGCARYNTVLLSAEYSSLKGIPISRLLKSWGKPTTMTYNADGTSQLNWKNIYSDGKTNTGLVPEAILVSMRKTTPMLCQVSMNITATGKVETHSLVCYADTEKRSPTIENSTILAEK